MKAEKIYYILILKIANFLGKMSQTMFGKKSPLLGMVITKTDASIFYL